MSMSPQDIQNLLAQIARIKAGGMGPNAPMPQVQQSEAVIPEQAPASAAPLPPPIDAGPMPQQAGPPPMMQPQAPPRVATPDDVRMNQLTAILDARNHPASAQPLSRGQNFLQNWLQPIGQGFAYGKDAPEVMARQRQQELQNRQADTQGLMAQIQQIQQRQQQAAEQARQQGADTRAQAESDRQAQAFPAEQKGREIQNAVGQNQVDHLNDPKFTAVPNDTTYGSVTPGTGHLDVQGQTPKTLPPTPDRPISGVDVIMKDGTHRRANFQNGIYSDLATGANITANVSGEYHPPPQAAPGADTAREDRSYQYNNDQLTKMSAPIDEALARYGKLKETLDGGSTTSEALVAPQLMTFMAGGTGSGVRITNAELQAISNARGFWEDLQAKASRYTDAAQLSQVLSPEQKTAIRKLADVVASKLKVKQDALNDARDELNDAPDVAAHRKILTDTRRKLADLDAGASQRAPSQGAVPAVGGTFNGAKVLKVEKIP